MTGDAMFSEVFLTGARVPAADIIGELDAGWAVALTTLAHERTGLGARAGTGFALTAPGGSAFRAQREVPAGEHIAVVRRGGSGRAGFGAGGMAMLGTGAAPLIQLAIDLDREQDALVR